MLVQGDTSYSPETSKLGKSQKSKSITTIDKINPESLKVILPEDKHDTIPMANRQSEDGGGGSEKLNTEGDVSNKPETQERLNMKPNASIAIRQKNVSTETQHKED